jgi:hypothetical protein
LHKSTKSSLFCSTDSTCGIYFSSSQYVSQVHILTFILLQKEEDITRQPNSSTPPTLDPSYLPEEILRLSEAMPFSLSGIPPRPTQVLIERYLPPVAAAVALCETYLRQLSWMTQIVSRSYVIGKLIPTIYGGLKHKDHPPHPGQHHRSSSSSSSLHHKHYHPHSHVEAGAEAEYGPHDLSLLFVLLAVGVLVDTSRTPYHIEAQHFYRLARASLVLQPPLKFASLTTVKVMHLMSIYDGLSGVEQMMERSYAMLKAATDVALRVCYVSVSSFPDVDNGDHSGIRSVYVRIFHFLLLPHMQSDKDT